MIAAVGAIALLSLAISAAPAGAQLVHVPDSTFTPSPAANNPNAVAVDEAAGSVYVMSMGGATAAGDIQKFDAEGNPTNFSMAPGANESQTVHFASFSNGNTFTLTCPNGETTDEIVWSSSAATVRDNMQAGLEAKCGAGNFSLTSGPNNPVVHFEGAFAETDVPHMTCTKTAGGGTCEITTEIDGEPPGEYHVLKTPCGSSCRQIAVDNSGGPNQGTIYVSRNGGDDEVAVFLPTGEQVASITGRSDEEDTSSFCGVAVDEEGHVYTSHSSSSPNGYIDEFQPLEWATNPAQDPAPSATIRPLDLTPCKIAVDSTSSIVAMSGTGSTSTGELRRFPGSAFGPPEEPFSEGVSTVILENGARHPAIDLSKDELYVAMQGEVAHYDSSDNLLETFGAEDGIGQGQGVAVNGATGTVYLTDRGTVDQIFIYTVIDAAVPTLDPASNVLQFAADVSGEVDPDGAGEVTECRFEYVEHTSFLSEGFATAESTPCSEATPYAAPQGVSAELSGLTAEEIYHFRLKAINGEGTNVTPAQTFMTRAVPGIETGEATEVGPRSVVLHGSFEGIGEQTNYYFLYGLSAGSYISSTAVEDAGTTTGPTNFSILLDELELETTYHYAVAAENSAGISIGDDMAFTTLPAVAALTTKPATEITQDGITLNGEFEGNGEQTSYYFEYGPTTAYGMQSEEAPGSDAGSPTGPTEVSTVIDRYEGYTTYHYRVVASSSFGETRGPDETFTTLPAPLPGVGGASASNIGRTSALLSAQVNPNRWPTVYRFEWGQSTGYGSATLLDEAIGGLQNADESVSEQVEGLTPGSVYHFRVVAINFTGVSYGSDQVFITPDVPEISETFSSSVGQSTALLTARVAAKSRPTTVSFEYGVNTAYGAASPPGPIGSGLFATQVDVPVGGLAPGTA